jgi:hypothetical protein
VLGSMLLGCQSPAWPQSGRLETRGWVVPRSAACWEWWTNGEHLWASILALWMCLGFVLLPLQIVSDDFSRTLESHRANQQHYLMLALATWHLDRIWSLGCLSL